MVEYSAWAGGSVTLTNTGDEVLLLNVFDDLVDAVSWGSSNWAFDPDVPVVSKGHSSERVPGFVDTDTEGDWVDQPAPTPGQTDITPLPTASPTPTAGVTVSSSPSPSPTASKTPSPSPTPSKTVTGSPSPSSTPSKTPTGSPSPSPTASKTATPTATKTPTGGPSPTPSKTPTPSAGGLLISEAVYDPDSPEPEGEWFEIHNPTGAAIVLAGFKVGDEEIAGGGEGMYVFPAGSLIPAHDVIVVANMAFQFEADHGWKPDFELAESDPAVPNLVKYTIWATGSISLSNTGDELLLLDAADELIDAVSWAESTWAFDPSVPDVAEGPSIERFPAGADTDTALDWVDQENPTPGSPS
jgi:hypothetical protein